MAWSRKALNLISALHSTSGLGVRPAWYSRRNSAKTRSLYSAAKLTCSISMPITSATAAASTKSSLDEQYSLSSSSSQFFMKMPTTSQPCCLSRYALTAESTPPLSPTTTRGLRPMVRLSQRTDAQARCRDLAHNSGMELRQLRYFVRVVELGSISRAALDLQLVQSALSQQISRLEGELATRLLQRTSKGVSADRGRPGLLPRGAAGLAPRRSGRARGARSAAVRHA